MDNTCPDNSGRAQRCIKASRAERLPHPTYSPDLTPIDFFLFKHIKRKPSDYSCENQEALLNAIAEIFTGVDQEVLLCVCESWVNRLKWVIKHEGKYHKKQRKNKRRFFKIGRTNGRTRTDGWI
jgi:hypothetical protein